MNTLARMSRGQKASITSCSDHPALAQRLMSMGILPGQSIERRQQAPLSGPIKIHSASSVIALRSCDAASVEVSHEH